MEKYQFVKWFPEWRGLYFYKPICGLGLVYDWHLALGFWEIRKWHVLKEGELETYNRDRKLG